MFTLTNLPPGKLYAFVTATRVNFDVAEDGVAGTGWIDWSWSKTTLHESRNDVRPLWDGDTYRVLNGHTYQTAAGDMVETAEDVREEVLDNIRQVIGHAASSERGNIDASDHQEWDLTTSDRWAYCVHVMVKHRAQDPVTGNWTGAWTESPVHIPAEDVNAPLMPKVVTS